MIERKITNLLLEWKNKNNKKCLLIKGSRQIGKTYIIRQFIRRFYEENGIIELNFEEDISSRNIFNGDISAESIINKLKINNRDKIFEKGKTVLFLDEIQSCPEAITALKFLSEDATLDVIATESLLGVSYNLVSSFPVGYIDEIQMTGLDFEEFLWANNITKETIEIVKNSFINETEVEEYYHLKFLKLFKDFIVVGGMPEVVKSFIKENDYTKVLKIQQQIVSDYKADISKYAHNKEKNKVRECFDSMPIQLAKDYKKFQYKYVSKGGRSNSYEGSIGWLVDSQIVNKCYNVSVPIIPLTTFKRLDAFKLYFSDTGLYVALLGIEAQTLILNGDLGISKGAIYENVIADLLRKRGKDLYYFEKNSTLELDFITTHDNNLLAIEVKSGENTRSRALISAIENYNVDRGWKLSQNNVCNKGSILCLPLYMIMFIYVKVTTFKNYKKSSF